MQSQEDSGGGGHTSSTLHALIGAASQQAQEQAQRSPHSSSRLFQQAPTEGLGGARNPSSAYVHGGVFTYDSGQQGGGALNTAVEYQSSQARPSHPSLTGAYGKPSPTLSGLPSLPSTDHSYSPFYGSAPSHPALPPMRPASYYAPASLPTPEPPALPMVGGGCHARPGNGGADDRQFPFVLPVDHADRNGSMRKVPPYASSPLTSSMDSTHSAVSAALNNFHPSRPSSAMAYNPIPSPSDMHQASPPPLQQYFVDPGAQGAGLGAPRPTLGAVAAAAAAGNGATDKAPPQGHQTNPESRALAGLLRLGGGAMGGAAVSTAAPSPQPSIPPPQPQAPPMQQVPRPALTQDHYVELSKEAWVRGYLEVARTGVVSRGKTLNVL